jgi:hypothetical protein
VVANVPAQVHSLRGELLQQRARELGGTDGCEAMADVAVGTDDHRYALCVCGIAGPVSQSYCVVHVTEERILKAVVRRKLRVLVRVVVRSPDDAYPQRGVLIIEIAERLALFGSSASGSFGVKPNDKSFASVVLLTHSVAIVVQAVKIRGDIADGESNHYLQRGNGEKRG